jgi:hypothetical protein
MLRRTAFACALLSFALGGCGGSTDLRDVDAAPIDAAVDAEIDAFVIPKLRNPVTVDDATLAMQAAQLIGAAGAKNCDQCHALSRARLQSWAEETTAGLAACFDNLEPTTQAEARAIVDCLREEPTNALSGWNPARLGVYTTAGDLEWFRYVFDLAFGAEGPTQLGFFQDQTLMPRGGVPSFTQAEFDIVAEWFARGLPEVASVIPADPPAGTCTDAISPEVATHVATMRQQGWRAINDEENLAMFGCAGATGPRQCLANFPKPSENPWSTGWDDAEPGAQLKLLREHTYSSQFWIRGSADGRYVATGGNGGGSMTYRATVIDLQRGAEIPAAAQYDPAFTPDNVAFMLQGGGPRVCEQSMLANAPAMITFGEPQCSTVNGIGLYQHLGAARGGDYWAVAGQFNSDNGGHSITTSDPGASSNSTSKITLTPFVHTGSSFVPRTGVQVDTPREGDVVLSGTAKLLVGRINGGNSTMIGFVMRKLIATPTGTGYEVSTPEIARYCLRGGKPAFSYDDRWMVYHHYVEAGDWQALGYASATDPAFVALRQAGAANIYVMDLLTGVPRRITTMNPGQYALYPFFRSDGWIYFLVRDRNRGREVIVASDAALKYEGL